MRTLLLWMMLGVAVILLDGCFGSYLLSGAGLLYDRHHVRKKVYDYELAASANQVIFKDTRFKHSNCVIDLTAFNMDLLVSGHVDTPEMKKELKRRLAYLRGYRHIYNEVKVSKQRAFTLENTWITTKIRTQILADDRIDPSSFKVVTTDGVVYLMGDVEANQAKRVLYIARHTSGLLKVVNLMRVR